MKINGVTIAGGSSGTSGSSGSSGTSGSSGSSGSSGTSGSSGSSGTSGSSGSSGTSGSSGSSGTSGSSGSSGTSGSSGSSGTSGINAFPVVSYNTTNLVLGLGDSSEYLRISGDTAVTVSIPPQSSVAWSADTEIIMEQRAAGQLTLSGGSGVTINKPSSTTAKSKEQYSVIAVKRVSQDVWTLFGDLSTT